MLLSLAQSPNGPINLFTGEPVPPAAPILPLWLGLTIIAAIIALSLVAWAILSRLAAIDKDPAEYAFRLLARRLHIPQRQASLLRKLASVVQCAPVALLVSPHALHAAALCYEKSKPSRRDRATLKQLAA
jgi:hypothetical protein